MSSHFPLTLRDDATSNLKKAEDSVHVSGLNLRDSDRKRKEPIQKSQSPSSTESSENEHSKKQQTVQPSSVASGSWRKDCLDHIHEMFTATDSLPSINGMTVWNGFQEHGTAIDAANLLSKDLDRIRSVILKYGDPKYKPPGKRLLYLGRQRGPLTTQFQKHHGLTQTQAIGLLNRRTANLLLNPATFKEGANELRPIQKKNPVRDGKSLHWKTRQKNLVKRHLDALKDRNRVTLLGGVPKHNLESHDHSNLADAGSGKNIAIEPADQSPSGDEILDLGDDTTSQPSKWKDVEVPIVYLPLIYPMMRVYLRYVPTSERTARRIIKETVIENPALINDLLSTNIQREKAALAQMRKPESRSPRLTRPIDELNNDQIQQAVDVFRQRGYASEKNARRVLRQLVKPEHVERLKDPNQFDEVMQEILKRSAKGKRLMFDPVARRVNRYRSGPFGLFGA